MFRIFKDADGSMYYVSKRKVRKDQNVIDVPGDVVPGASGGFTFATDAELFRVPSNSLPPAQDIWDANKRMDKYTGFSQKETENFGFEDLSKFEIVKDYERFEKERAIQVERDHTVEIQMVSRACDRVKGKQPNTRSTVECLRESVNHLDNLNCTPGAVNMRKRDAVKEFLSGYERRDENGLRQTLARLWRGAKHYPPHLYNI